MIICIKGLLQWKILISIRGKSQQILLQWGVAINLHLNLDIHPPHWDVDPEYILEPAFGLTFLKLSNMGFMT